VTEQIAKLGYGGIAPPPFEGQAPGFETGYTCKNMEVGRKYAWLQTTVSQLLSDI
jgi:carboxymethylenebutenolidase